MARNVISVYACVMYSPGPAICWRCFGVTDRWRAFLYCVGVGVANVYSVFTDCYLGWWNYPTTNEQSVVAFLGGLI